MTVKEQGLQQIVQAQLAQIDQLQATLKDVARRAYAAGYNACLRENVAVNKNKVRP